MSNFSFSTDGTNFSLINDCNTVVKNLPVGIYNLCIENRHHTLYLERIGDKFTFAFERFDLEDEFINHIIKRYSKLNKSMGVLLNGVKGSGKTCTAKTLANELNLPIIIISELLEGMDSFIQKIHNPCCILLDEFEKTSQRAHNTDSQILLSLLDGARSGDTKHVFILTTNELRIDDNYISRPGRILYHKSYTSLSDDVITKYVKKNLTNQEYYEEMMFVINKMTIKSIDTIKVLVDEVNDMDITPKKAIEYLNIHITKYKIICEEKSLPEGSSENDTLSEMLTNKQSSFRYIGHIYLETPISPNLLKVGDKIGSYEIKEREGNYLLIYDNDYKKTTICEIEKTEEIGCYVSDLKTASVTPEDLPF